jgi:hypothetical protein
MQKFEPVGRKMLVLPLKEENYKTSSGLELVQLEFTKAKVVEVSKEYSNMYMPGNIVVISSNTGVGQAYNGESCLIPIGTTPTNAGNLTCPGGAPPVPSK